MRAADTLEYPVFSSWMRSLTLYTLLWQWHVVVAGVVGAAEGADAVVCVDLFLSLVL